MLSKPQLIFFVWIWVLKHCVLFAKCSLRLQSTCSLIVRRLNRSRTLLVLLFASQSIYVRGSLWAFGWIMYHQVMTIISNQWLKLICGLFGRPGVTLFSNQKSLIVKKSHSRLLGTSGSIFVLHLFVWETISLWTIIHLLTVLSWWSLTRLMQNFLLPG